MSNKEEKIKKGKKKQLILFYAVILFLSVIVFFVLYFPLKKEEKGKKIMDHAAVDRICELATLRCFYHDVAEYEKQPDGLFKFGLFKYGYKKLWLEYDGIVEVGIDVGQVVVHEPDEEGIVKIKIPRTKILNVSADKDTMRIPVMDTGFFTSVKTEEKAKAFTAAQSAMKEKAETDESIKLQAYNNAKELLKQYVMNVGAKLGKDYTVEWIEEEENDGQQK